MEEPHRLYKDAPFGWVLMLQEILEARERWRLGRAVPAASQASTSPPYRRSATRPSCR